MHGHAHNVCSHTPKLSYECPVSSNPILPSHSPPPPPPPSPLPHPATNTSTPIFGSELFMGLDSQYMPTHKRKKENKKKERERERERGGEGGGRADYHDDDGNNEERMRERADDHDNLICYIIRSCCRPAITDVGVEFEGMNLNRGPFIKLGCVCVNTQTTLCGKLAKLGKGALQRAKYPIKTHLQFYLALPSMGISTKFEPHKW